MNTIPRDGGPWMAAPTAEQGVALKTQFQKHRNPHTVITGYREDVPARDSAYEPLFSFGGKPDPTYGTRGFYCSSCNTHEKFKHGVAVWYADGYIRFLGKDCGADFYGSDGGAFRQAIRNMEAAERRAEREARWPAIRELVPMLRIEVVAFGNSAAIQQLFQFRATLQRKMPALFTELSRYVGRGQLFIERRLAEPRYVGGRREDYEEVPYGALRGGAGILPDNNPRALMTAAAAQLTHFAGTDFSSLKDKQQIALLTKLDEMLAADVARGATIMANATEFIGRGNLATICRWASDNPRCMATYRFQGGAIEMVPPDGDSETINLPNLAGLPDVMTTVARLRLAIAGGGNNGPADASATPA